MDAKNRNMRRRSSVGLHQTALFGRGVALLAACFCQMVAVGVPFSLVAYFLVWLQHFDEGRPVTSLVQGVAIGLTFGSGIFSGMVTGKLGSRFSIMAGSVVAAIGFFSSFFATDVVFLIIAIGVGTGIGNSLIYIGTMVSITTIFRRRLSFVLALNMTAAGVGGVIGPYVIYALTAELGWRGSLVILSGVYLHCLVAGLLVTARTMHGRLRRPSLVILPGFADRLRRASKSLSQISVGRRASRGVWYVGSEMDARISQTPQPLSFKTADSAFGNAVLRDLPDYSRSGTEESYDGEHGLSKDNMALQKSSLEPPAISLEIVRDGQSKIFEYVDGTPIGDASEVERIPSIGTTLEKNDVIENGRIPTHQTTLRAIISHSSEETAADCLHVTSEVWGSWSRNGRRSFHGETTRAKSGPEVASTREKLRRSQSFSGTSRRTLVTTTASQLLHGKGQGACTSPDRDERASVQSCEMPRTTSDHVDGEDYASAEVSLQRRGSEPCTAPGSNPAFSLDEDDGRVESCRDFHDASPLKDNAENNITEPSNSSSDTTKGTSEMCPNSKSDQVLTKNSGETNAAFEEDSKERPPRHPVSILSSGVHRPSKAFSITFQSDRPASVEENYSAVTSLSKLASDSQMNSGEVTQDTADRVVSHASGRGTPVPTLREEEKEEEEEEEDRGGVSRWSFLRNPIYVLMVLNTIFAFPMVNSVVGVTTDYARERLHEDSHSAIFLLLINLVGVGSRLGAGLIRLSPKVHSLPLFCVAGLFSCAAVALLALAHDLPLMTVGFALHGLGFGALVASFPVTVLELVGAEHYGLGLGVASTCNGLSSALGAPITGALHDASGSYQLSFLLFSGVSLVLFCTTFLTFLVTWFKQRR